MKCLRLKNGYFGSWQNQQVGTLADSCLPLQSKYLFSVLLFVVNNKDLYTTNQEIHNITTISNINSHPPICNLTALQKGANCSGINLFNQLPLKIKCLKNEIKLFKSALKRFLKLHSFYTLEDDFEYGYN